MVVIVSLIVTIALTLGAMNNIFYTLLFSRFSLKDRGRSRLGDQRKRFCSVRSICQESWKHHMEWE